MMRLSLSANLPLAAVLLGLGLLLSSGLGFAAMAAPVEAASPGSSATPAPPPAGRDPDQGAGGMVPTPDWMMPPELPANPSQADLGEQVYYYVCMSCHGDKGQGLSKEWVASWGLGPKGCWESKCHASNHPPEGFTLPNYIPPVVGPVMAARFPTAADLHTFIQTKMPWHAPGSLKDDETWQVTAFLLRLNGFDPGAQTLDAQTAAAISLRPTSQPTLAPTPSPVETTARLPYPGGWGGAAVSGVVAAGLLLLWLRAGRALRN